MREPNFMMPNRSPARTSRAGRDPAHHAPREHADDLPRDDRLTAVVDPDLAPLVCGPRVVAVGRQKPAGLEAPRASPAPRPGSG